MPRGLDDPVRAYQLPTTSPAQLYQSQYNLASKLPIHITPGFGGSGGSTKSPQVLTGSGHFDETITYYVEQASVEVREA